MDGPLVPGGANDAHPDLAWRQCSRSARSPARRDGDLGPFHMYGIILAVGVLVGGLGERAPLAQPRLPTRRHLRHRLLGRGVGRDRRRASTTWSPTTSSSPTTPACVRDLARWPRDLGCGARRRDRGGGDHQAPPLRHARRDGLHGARDHPRPSDRTLGQLLQPGAVREADHAAMGARDRTRAPTTRLRAVRDLPAHVPLRVALLPRRVRRSSSRWSTTGDSSAGRPSRST